MTALLTACRAELTKVLTLALARRTLLLTPLVVGLLSLAIGRLTADALAAGRPGDAAGLEPATAFLVVLHYAQVAAILVGAWALAQEQQDSGLMTTLVAVPRRGLMLLAKALVVGGSVFLMGVASGVLALLSRCASSDCAAWVTTSAVGDGVLVLGLGTYWAVLATLTLLLGFGLRSGLASLGIMLALVLAASPYLLSHGRWARYLPDQVGARLFDLAPPLPDDLSGPQALGVLAGWILLAAAAAFSSLSGWAVGPHR